MNRVVKKRLWTSVGSYVYKKKIYSLLLEIFSHLDLSEGNNLEYKNKLFADLQESLSSTSETRDVA